MHNCSGVRLSDTVCMRNFATCMPLMLMTVTLVIMSGRCVFISESTVLPELPEVVLMAEPHGKLSFDSNTEYVNLDEIVRATNAHSIQDDKYTLVQKGIKLHHWLFESPFCEMFPHVHFYADFNETMIDEKTPANLYIT